MLMGKTNRFEAIFFDLYNTLLHFDYSRIPKVNFKGKSFRTTSVKVYEALKRTFTIQFTYECFLEAFLESKRIINRTIKEEYREISCFERFKIVFSHLDIEDMASVEFMVKIHMNEMFQMMYCPDDTKEVLKVLEDYPLVLVSNFDHAPTARKALKKFGLENYFEAIFISEEVGWRKPGETLFEIALEKTGYHASKCLFVGDDPRADVHGAGRKGFQVAWLARDPSEELRIAPRWTIRELTEVVGIVRNNDRKNS